MILSLFSKLNLSEKEKNTLFARNTAFNERKHPYHYLTFFPKCDQNGYICEKTLTKNRLT